MPSLTDFSPRLIDADGRKGLGVVFRCTTGHCNGLNVVLFANPLDGGPPATATTWDDQRKLCGIEIGSAECAWLRGCGTTRWVRSGHTIENLTLSPSVNMHQCGHFTVTNGKW